MVWILCIFMLFLSSCDQKPQESQYKEVVVQALQTVTPVASAPADQAMPSMGMPAGTMDSSVSNMFSWSVPQGWKQEAGEGMRLASFHLSSDAKAIDCSIVTLGGIAGGLEANLRRWMGQIGVKATDAELSTLISSAPSVKIKSGQEGKIFDFTSIQSKAESTVKSMVVVMSTLDEATLFVKMTGTLGSVSKNKADFFKLVDSVEYHAPSAGVAATDTGMNPSAADPHAGLDMSQMGGMIEAPTTQNILAWVAPAGWKEEAGKHMRMASFHPVANPQAMDCYIIALAGPAGGLEANLQRWLGQLGLQASDDNVSKLGLSAQTLRTKDGLEVKVFDFTDLQAQGSPSDKSMIAAMIALNQTTVFVKMTGPIESVKENKDNYLKLLGSITRK